MKKLVLCALFSLFALRSQLSAESMKLTNKQADELLGALLQIGPGLSAANTTKAARDILALRPIVEAYAKGIEAARTNNRITAATKLDSPDLAAANAEAAKLQAEVLTIELTRFTLADEELDRAKPSPAALATLLLYLEPKGKT